MGKNRQKLSSMVRAFNTFMVRIDMAVIRFIDTRIQPAHRARQASALAYRVDTAVLNRLADAVTRERREQLRNGVGSVVRRTRKTASAVIDALRRPEAPEVVALREEAAALGARLSLLIKEADSDALAPSWVVELTRWNTLLALEASGDAAATDSAARQAIEYLSGAEAMRAGDRALMGQVRDIAVKRDLTQVEMSAVLAVMQGRMTLAKIRHQRGEISTDSLAWDLVEARENLRLYLVDDEPSAPEPFSKVRALIEAQQDQAAA